MSAKANFALEPTAAALSVLIGCWRSRRARLRRGTLPGGCGSVPSLDYETYMKATVLALLVLGTMLVQADEKLYDDALAKKAVAVLRVKLNMAYDLAHQDKYPLTRYQIHVIHIFKNDSNLPIGDCAVDGFKGRPGVPPGESTIYVERYYVIPGKVWAGGTNGTIWMLVGGDATNGVSHVGSQPSLR